jgi:glutamyl-tRNA reductase
MEKRRNRQMFLIDIAVPRDIAPEAGDLYNVVLYDIDDLQAVVGTNLQKRKMEAEKAQAILDDEVEAFCAWLASLDVVPAIVALRQRFEAIMQAELESARLSDLSEDQRRRVAGLMRQFANKLLHTPVTQLKRLAEEGDGAAHVDSMLALFDLAGEVRGGPAKGPSGRSLKDVEA